ncbi:gastrula zinc finger protein XlCGF16.1-like, partial [Oncorhynchus kisutch]|uniref:gastrula zinc finger protein XlCGF16.1-like n=1 Tax=Oncorhynchus kisutch TaxID=8019 RepID=UPI0012DC0861
TEEGEPDLLIIKVEGEADDQDSRISHPARTVEGSRELTTRNWLQPPQRTPPSSPVAPEATTIQTPLWRPGTIERPYGCPNCHKKFVHESDLRQHVVIHTRKRVFACTLCEKSFVSPSKLQVHQNVHTGEKPFSCAQCGRRFSQSSNLNRHQKLHH